eukprot:s407_g4.t1
MDKIGGFAVLSVKRMDVFFRAGGRRVSSKIELEDGNDEDEDYPDDDPDGEDLEEEMARGEISGRRIDDDEEEEYETATAAELSEAYAAGWKANAPASGHRQARGYKQQRLQGDWRGDPECPDVPLHPRHQGSAASQPEASNTHIAFRTPTPRPLLAVFVVRESQGG